jgi:hypothetical protein
VEGGWWRDDKVQVEVGDWIITLDTYTVSTGKSSHTYTRIRAPYVNRDGLRFTIYRAGFFSELGKMLGMEDIEVGDAFFDQAFIIQGNDPHRVRWLFSNPRIRELIHVQPAIHLSVKDDEGWFGPHFPQGVDQLSFQVGGIIKDLDILRGLFDLFAEVLNQLGHMDSGHEDDLMLHIQALNAPGGSIMSEDVLLWDGTSARRRAALQLARTRDARAAEALIHVLNDRDDEIRWTAIRGLGHIGDPRAVRWLIPMLGDEAATANINSAAAEALERLGHRETVEAFRAILRGEPDALERLEAAHPQAAAEAMLRALVSPNPATVIHAARAVAEMKPPEAVARLKEARRRFGKDSGVRGAVDDAIRALEVHASLPRPAKVQVPDAADLPRPAAEPRA